MVIVKYSLKDLDFSSLVNSYCTFESELMVSLTNLASYFE